MTRLRQLQQTGVSIWLDTLSRDLLDSGEFERLVGRGVTGATSNPTIFAQAITGSPAYDRQLADLLRGGVSDPQELFFALALDDVRAAAGLLRPVYDQAGGGDGFVSFECTPDVADDTAATIEQAWDLWTRLHLPNVMIKVPATPAGIPAIAELTARGVNVNITLLFALGRYEQVIEAYMSGLERRAAREQSLDHIASVASFFVSRVDTKADAELAPGSPLRGTVAVTNARLAYRLHQERFTSARWQALAAKGARDQRPLWASTGTKNPEYSDVLYVDRLIAPGVINTMPMATLEAYDHHGDPQSPRSASTTLMTNKPTRPCAPRASTWTGSPPRWNAKASTHSRAPTTNSSPASRRRRRISPMRRHQCILCAKDVDLEDRGTRWKAHGTLVTIRAARVLDYPVIAADRQRDRCGVAVDCNVRQGNHRASWVCAIGLPARPMVTSQIPGALRRRVAATSTRRVYVPWPFLSLFCSLP